MLFHVCPPFPQRVKYFDGDWLSEFNSDILSRRGEELRWDPLLDHDAIHARVEHGDDDGWIRGFEDEF